MAADSADFLIDLGDTWMTDKYRADYKESLIHCPALLFWVPLQIFRAVFNPWQS